MARWSVTAWEMPPLGMHAAGPQGGAGGRSPRSVLGTPHRAEKSPAGGSPASAVRAPAANAPGCQDTSPAKLDGEFYGASRQLPSRGAFFVPPARGCALHRRCRENRRPADARCAPLRWVRMPLPRRNRQPAGGCWPPLRSTSCRLHPLCKGAFFAPANRAKPASPPAESKSPPQNRNVLRRAFCSTVQPPR